MGLLSTNPTLEEVLLHQRGLLHTPDVLMQLQMGLLNQTPRGVFWHGSPSGGAGRGRGEVHLGTKLAAEQALGARIGIPASGSWVGNTRPYGETLLAGRDTLERLGPYTRSGYNVDAPKADYYPSRMPSYGRGGGEVLPSSVPSVLPYTITGPMTNSPLNPHADAVANGLMARAISQGNARRGFYYRNTGEDTGSIAAVVPSMQHLTPWQYIANLFGGG